MGLAPRSHGPSRARKRSKNSTRSGSRRTQSASPSKGYAQASSGYTWYDPLQCSINSHCSCGRSSPPQLLTPCPSCLTRIAQFGTYCTEMNESNKFEFMLDVIRYRVSSSCFFDVLCNAALQICEVRPRYPPGRTWADHTKGSCRRGSCPYCDFQERTLTGERTLLLACWRTGPGPHFLEVDFVHRLLCNRCEILSLYVVDSLQPDCVVVQH